MIASRHLQHGWLADRARIVGLIALALGVLLLGTGAYLWHERARLLDTADEEAVRLVQRLASDLEKSLTVAEVAVLQVEEVLAGGAPEPMRRFWTPEAAELRADLLSTLPLPFQLHAFMQDGQVIELVSDRLQEKRTAAEELGQIAEASPGRWHVPAVSGSPGSKAVPLVWQAAANARQVAGYAVDLSFSALLDRLENDRIKDGGGVALFRVAQDNSVSVLVRAPFDGSETGQMVRGHVAQMISSRVAGSFLTRGQFDGIERRVAFRRLAGTASEMVVVYGVPTHAVLSEWYRRLPAIGLAALTLSLALILGGWQLDRSVRRLQREVNERRALEEQRRQMFHDMDTVANASPVLFWTCDTDMQCDWFNRRWLAFTGRSMADELGEGWAQSLHPDDRDNCLSRFHKAFIQRKVFSIEYRLRRHDGEYRWILDQGTPRHDADGRFTGYIGSCIDLTELRQAQADSQQRTETLERVFDVLQDMLFVLDRQGTFLHFHSGSSDKLYAQPRKILGHRIDEVLPAELAELTRQRLALAFEGPLQDYDYNMDLPTGPHVFNARLARLPDSEQCMMVVRDVTAQRHLQRDRERLNHLVMLLLQLATRFINLPRDRLDQAILDGLQEMGSFIGMDRAYVFRYDFDRQACSNTHEWCAHGIAPQRELLQNIPLDRASDMVKAHQAGECISITDVSTLPEGWLRDVLMPLDLCSLIMLPINTSQACIGFVGFDAVRQAHQFRDDEQALLRLFAQMLANSAERHAAEEAIAHLNQELEARVAERTQALRASVRRLEEVNTNLQAFSYSVSHDLKSPLRGIEGFASLLQETYGDQIPEPAVDYLERIRKAASHMARLINDLLAYSHLEQKELALEVVPLRPLVQAVVDGLRNEIDLKGASIGIDMVDTLRVQASRSGLSMVLRNLVDNALKFAKPGQPPRIDIVAGIVDCADGPCVRLSVIDQGQGFDMKHHDRIFAIFQRLHRADEAPGTGIGLAMVHKAVTRMGGLIRAESAPGQGARFHIELPPA
ncbi:MAG: ATP-binding protein [Gammaproteobacteria bacterium]